MSATETTSRAILKRKFDKGTLPKATFASFPFLAAVPKNPDLDGDDYQSPIQNENPQASSADYQTAAGNFEPGVYNRFLVTQVKHYSLARIQGDVMKRAEKKGDGAFVDLWDNETKGASATEQKCLEQYLFRNGTGMCGQVSTTSTVASTVISLANGDDIICFDLGQKVEATSLNTLAGVKRTGTAKITGINRDPDTASLTSDANWSSQINGLTVGDFIGRAGDSHLSGTARVLTGMASWVAGGTAPGTLFSCNRDTDPVRLAGQTKDYTNESMETSIIDAQARMGFQGAMGSGWWLVANTRDVANLKKTAISKVVYDRIQSSMAGLSFKAIEIDGDYGPIRILASPFCPRNTAYLGDPEELRLESMGPAPQLLDWDKNNFLRTPNDDAYEVRFGMYGFYQVRNPSRWFRLQGWGA